MSVLSRFVAFGSAARRCPAAGLVRNRRLAAAIMALALAAATAPLAWAADPRAISAAAAPPAGAAGPQNQPPPHATAAAVSTEHPGYPVSTAPTELTPDGTLPEAVVKAGVETRALRAWDCDMPNRAPVVWARADHGTISVKPVTSGPMCGRLSMTVAGIFYTSEPGFKGADTIYLLGFKTQGKIEVSFTILVK